MNLPNLITCFRILAAFVVLYYGFLGRWEIGFPVFCVAAVTDMVDGTIARLLGQRTRLGGFLDPAADKLLMFFSFLTLTKTGYLPVWLTALVIARDLMITVGLLILKRAKAYIIYRPTYLSKMTTFFQILTVFTALLTTQNLSRLPAVVRDNLALGLKGIIGIAVVLTGVTAVQYYRIGRNLLKNAQAQADRQ